MKKLFTMFAVCAATLVTYTASAGTPLHAEKGTLSQTMTSKTWSNPTNLRSISCDTLSNETALDTPNIYLSGAPNEGYFSGNGALNAGGTTFYPISGIAEKYTAAAANLYVTSAFVIFGVPTINAADSGVRVTAYVYDTTGTSLIFNETAPGNAIDSGFVTLGSIAHDVQAQQITVFNFAHQPALPSAGFYVAVGLPLITGDSIEIATNQGTTGDGRAYIELSAAGQSAWGSFDSLTGAPIGAYIIPSVCSSQVLTCPTITVSATQSGSTGTASAAGGAGTYTYAWSNNATGATATGLVNGTTYHVTATDMNGCTGVGQLTIAGITAIEAGVTNFSVFPNPSNGAFTASITLETASDVTISIVDMTGSKIYESTDKSVKDLNKSINLSTAATGVYFVSVKTDKGTANQRIVIQ